MKLADLEHQETNGQVKVSCRTLGSIAHSLMVHARVLEAYIHFELMYTEDHILPVIPIKDLTKGNRELTTPFKLATGTKPSVSNLRMLFFPCVVRKATAHVGTKALNMRHHGQYGFRVISVELGTYTRCPFWCCVITTKIPQKPFCAW